MVDLLLVQLLERLTVLSQALIQRLSHGPLSGEAANQRPELPADVRHEVVVLPLDLAHVLPDAAKLSTHASHFAGHLAHSCGVPIRSHCCWDAGIANHRPLLWR